MINQYRGHPFQAQKLCGFNASVSRKDVVVAIDKDRVVKAKCADTFRYLPDLLC
jgi:hypothetical protein